MFDNWTPSGLQLILFAIGGGLLYLGEDWGVAWASEIGIGILGLLLAVIGIEISLKRIRDFRANGWSNIIETYRGVLALLWAAILIALGLLIMAVALMNTLVPGGIGDVWREMLLGHTGMGVILSVTGLIMMLNGLIRALAGSGTWQSAHFSGFRNVLDRAAGAAGLVLGAAVAAAGLLFLTAPGWLTTGGNLLLNLVR